MRKKCGQTVGMMENLNLKSLKFFVQLITGMNFLIRFGHKIYSILFNIKSKAPHIHE